MEKQRNGLARKIELLHNSSERMMKALGLSRDAAWWRFMRREVWLHLKRTLELMWMVLRRKG